MKYVIILGVLLLTGCRDIDKEYTIMKDMSKKCPGLVETTFVIGDFGNSWSVTCKDAKTLFED